MSIAESLRMRPATLMRFAGVSAALTLGACHAWAGRHSINIDGVSYLDLGDALARGDWANGVNAHWSPLYPWLLGLAMMLAQPSPYWEFAVAHGVNFLIFVCAIAAFDVLLRAILARQRRTVLEGDVTLPEWAWVGLGYLLFLWASLQLTELWILTPDLALSVFVYLAAAMVVSLHRVDATVARYAALGAVLAVGYLAKAPMFVFAFVFLALAWLVSGANVAAARKVAVAALVFLVLSAPFVTALSLAKGRLTFGESRTLAFAWFVNQVPFRHWQGGDPVLSAAEHPTRKVLDTPAVYEFATPVAGSYPAWYDPSYWYEGIQPRWDADDISATLMVNLRELTDMFVSYVQVSLLVGIAALVLLGGSVSRFTRTLAGQWPLLLPAVAGIGLYSTVSVFPRYVAPFMLLLWLGVLAAVQLPNGVRVRRLMTAAASTLIVVLVGLLSVEIGPPAAAGAMALVSGEDEQTHTAWQVAAGAQRLGLQPGAQVAWLHPAPEFVSWSGMTGWARLARVRIVAEVSPEGAAHFWQASPEVRETVLDVLASTGATFAVTMKAPPGASDLGWDPIGHTGYFAYRLTTRSARITDTPRMRSLTP